jgi:hypothetical protein
MYECIKTVVEGGMLDIEANRSSEEKSLMDVCASKLGILLHDRDPNCMNALIT